MPVVWSGGWRDPRPRFRGDFGLRFALRLKPTCQVVWSYRSVLQSGRSGKQVPGTSPP